MFDLQTIAGNFFRKRGEIKREGRLVETDPYLSTSFIIELKVWHLNLVCMQERIFCHGKDILTLLISIIVRKGILVLINILFKKIMFFLIFYTNMNIYCKKQVIQTFVYDTNFCQFVYTNWLILSMMKLNFTLIN